ncbi:MAG: hypothetical protein ABI838_02450 [Chloroflexota bacterium]
MAGTSWDKLGQMDAAFEVVAPAIRRAAQASGARLHEFFRDDPVWRLDFTGKRAGDPAVDVSWSEEAPAAYLVTALWWQDDKLTREEVGTFTREQPLEELDGLLDQAVAKLPG